MTVGNMDRRSVADNSYLDCLETAVPLSGLSGRLEPDSPSALSPERNPAVRGRVHNPAHSSERAYRSASRASALFRTQTSDSPATPAALAEAALRARLAEYRAAVRGGIE